MPAATAARFAWSKTAPLGRPVVPLVHTTATGSDGSGRFTRVGPGPSSAAATSARSTTVPEDPGRVTPSIGSTTVTTGWARAVMLSSSAGPRRGFTPLVTAPSAMAAA